VDPVGVIFIIGGSLALVYGLLDLFFPQLTIRWQVRSTERARGLKRSVGEAFQRTYGIDPTAEPSDNTRARRLVRWNGVVLIVFGGLVIGTGFLLLNRPG
jgi:hypothetical protein